MIYYIADLHLGHENIRAKERSQFKNCLEMQEYMLKRWNSVVTKNDDVYIIGDVWMKITPGGEYFLNNVKGNLHLVKGNHDHVNKWGTFVERFVEIVHYIQISDSGKRVILFHYPIESWNQKFRGSIHIHGHVHSNTQDCSIMFNRYNAWCPALDYQPRPLSWFIKTYGYNEDAYKIIVKGGSEISNMVEDSDKV